MSSSIVSLTAEETRDLRNLWKKIKRQQLKYESPLSNMPNRAPPSASNIIKVKGGCPPPLKACDAEAAQREGKTCPDPRLAVYPYIQVEETGALCYPNLNTAAMQREMREEKKALARKSILDLIKVLAAIEDGDATPDMCNVVNQMTGKPAALKQAYCDNLLHQGTKMCSFQNNTCVWSGAQPSGRLAEPLTRAEEVPPPPPPAPVVKETPPPPPPPAAPPAETGTPIDASGSKQSYKFMEREWQFTKGQIAVIENPDLVKGLAMNNRVRAINGDQPQRNQWLSILEQLQSGQINTVEKYVAATKAVGKAGAQSTAAPSSGAPSPAAAAAPPSGEKPLISEERRKTMSAAALAMADAPDF